MSYGETNHTVVTDEELQKALKFVKARRQSAFADLHPDVAKLLELVVDRLIETSTVFNQHEHVVSDVQPESDDYHTAGSGRTGAPASEGGYGCERAIRIGLERC